MLDPAVAARLKDALYAQQYHLLLGSGVSLDATKGNEPLLSAEELRKQLCAVVKVKEASPLWRVAGYLTDEQVNTYLTKPYFGCKAGPTTQAITKLIWKTIFTLNIDDALENAYEQNVARMQSSVPVNYTREFELFRNPREIPIVHIHGFTRLPDDKYVFSMQEYARIQRGINPWVHLLSSLIVSEPFIISGTSLFEPDLEYFFAHRSTKTEIVSRAPSFLVEPFPDAGTAKDCERLGLILVKATLTDFINWIIREYGPAPTPLALRSPKQMPKVTGEPATIASTAFWTDFEYVVPVQNEQMNSPDKPSAFLFGRQPSWDDIAKKVDVPLRSQLEVMDECRRWLASSEAKHVVCLFGHAGSGKSTSVKRVAYELASRDFQVFYLRARDGLDVESAVEYLSAIDDPILIAVDSIAEVTEDLSVIMKRLPPAKRLLVLSAERHYRIQYVKDTLAFEGTKYIEVGRWRREERTALIENYIKHGLVGNAEALKAPSSFSKEIERNLVSESVCRILNDFRPLKIIVRSLWNDAIAESRSAYLAV